MKSKLRILKEFEGGEGKIEGGAVKAKLRVMKEFEGGEGKIEGSEGIRGW